MHEVEDGTANRILSATEADQCDTPDSSIWIRADQTWYGQDGQVRLSYSSTALVVPENNAVHNRTESDAFRLAAGQCVDNVTAKFIEDVPNWPDDLPQEASVPRPTMSAST
jgi:hypothetical protein